MMCVGLNLTYMTTKVPNFAHGVFVTVGIYTAYALFRLNRLTPYESLPLSFLLGGSVAVAMYVVVLRPLSRRGSSTVSLMIGTLGVDVVFVGIFGIYSDYLYTYKGLFDAKLFPPLVTADFHSLGVSGVFVTAPAAMLLGTLFLYLLLSRTKFGTAMRATVENPNLARTLGVNTELVYLFSWFTAGGLAAVAGSFYSLWEQGEPDIGSILLVTIFAGSILGGLESIWGGLVGGLVVGVTEIVITTFGAQLLGAWVLNYEPGIPLLIMVAVLLIVPRGLTSVKWRGPFRRGDAVQ